MNFDAIIVQWVNGHNAPWLDEVMWTVSQPTTWIPLYVLLLGLIAYRYRNLRKVFTILIWFVIAVGLSDFICSGILKPFVGRQRPTWDDTVSALHLVHGYIGGEFGFCSSHAATTMVVATLFSMLYRSKIAAWCLGAWVVVVCYSRIYLGVHYLTDIMAGLLIGALLAVVAWLVLTHLYNVDDEDEESPQADS